MGETKKTAGADRKALYRKYRTKSLGETIGQEHVTETLANALKAGKISHAYLFTGPRGTGKTSIARILAHEINNIPYEDEKTHLDIIEIDAASNRRIDDIRDLRDKVNIAPVNAKYKVYIIDEVHMLTSESFNALLKTLEEPPEHVVFMLATTEIHKLPATIISRTQRHNLRLIPQEKVMKRLRFIADTEGIKIDDESLSLLAEHGGGSFRDSISLLDQLSGSTEPITKELVELLFGLAPEAHLQNVLQAVQEASALKVLSEVTQLTEAGLTPHQIANQLVTTIRKNIKSGQVSKAHVALMSDLMNVNTAQFPLLLLESILLRAMPEIVESITSVEPQPEIKPTLVSEEQPKPTARPKKADVSAITDASTPKSTINDSKPKNDSGIKSGDVLKQWPKILEATKKQNNPLYTVLRLATPELTDDGLTLYFGFPFHQKKIDEVKYKTIIAEIVHEITGNSLTITTAVDKNKVKNPEPITTNSAQSDPAHASLISNVQDIMGGGEVVNE